MHSYINPEKVFDFSEKIDYDTIYEDLTEVYKVKNLDYEYEDAVDLLICTLLDDYESKRVNYKAFIEDGIDARILFELRRNAFVKMPDNITEAEYCREHNNCETIEQLKELRLKTIKRYAKEYEDYDWQYALLMKWIWGLKIREFYFDFEVCFEDRKTNVQRLPEDYAYEFNKFMFDNFNRNFPNMHFHLPER